MPKSTLFGIRETFELPLVCRPLQSLMRSDTPLKYRVFHMKYSISLSTEENDSGDYLSLGLFKGVTIGCITLLESLHPLEKHRIQSRVFDTPQNGLNRREKFIHRLE
jgi:hypothetical protein